MYSWFLFKVSQNIELANTEPFIAPMGNRVGFLWAPCHNIFINPSICCLVYICLCLQTPFQIYIVDSLTLNSWPVALYLIPDGSLSDPHIFSVRYITTFLCLQMPGNTSALCSGTILNSKITIRECKNAKNLGTK